MFPCPRTPWSGVTRQNALFRFQLARSSARNLTCARFRGHFLPGPMMSLVTFSSERHRSVSINLEKLAHFEGYWPRNLESRPSQKRIRETTTPLSTDRPANDCRPRWWSEDQESENRKRLRKCCLLYTGFIVHNKGVTRSNARNQKGHTSDLESAKRRKIYVHVCVYCM